MMNSIRTALLFAVSASGALAQTPAASQNDSEAPEAPPMAKSLDLSAIDKSTDSCTDFYQYARGNWIKDNPVPADWVRWVRSFSLLQERHLYGLRQELAKAATKPASPLDKKYGAFLAACMDLAELEKMGLESLKPALERISALNDSKGIAALISDLATAGDPAPPFGLDVEPDPRDSKKRILNVSQAGLTLRIARTMWVTRDISSSDIKAIEYVCSCSPLIHSAEPRRKRRLFSVSRQRWRKLLAIARIQPTERHCHIHSFADLQKLTPDFDFKIYFKSLAVLPVETLNVANSDFLKTVNRLIISLPVDS